jgi:hypothetical protein
MMQTDTLHYNRLLRPRKPSGRVRIEAQVSVPLSNRRRRRRRNTQKNAEDLEINVAPGHHLLSSRLEYEGNNLGTH